MKIFYTAMSMLIASIILVSCSKDEVQEPVNMDATNLQMEYGDTQSSSRAPMNPYEVNQQLIAAMDGHYPELPLSQGLVDEYADAIGLSESIDASLVNDIAEGIVYTEEVGLSKFLDEKTALQSYTKKVILDIHEKGPVSDLSNSNEFNDLPRGEQELLHNINNYTKDFLNGMKGKQMKYGGCSYMGMSMGCVEKAALIGATVGFGVGYGFCGPGCGFIVGTVGAGIGWVVGWVANGFSK